MSVLRVNEYDTEYDYQAVNEGVMSVLRVNGYDTEYD